jgi:AcrR family transcriptional regulator
MTSKTADPTPATRDRILDVAERLFAEQGFAATSVRQITDAAGANLGAVNYHFHSKEDLYTEVFVRRAAILRQPILEAVTEAARVADADPEAGLLVLGQAFLIPHKQPTPPLLVGLFAREAIESRLPPRLFKREFFAPTIEAIETVLRRVRPGLPELMVRESAHAFFAQLMHIVKRVAVEGEPLDAQLEYAVRFTVAAVMNIEAGRPQRTRRETQRKQS